MALGFSENTGGGSDRLDYLKYNARAGRLYRVDRENDGSGWVTSETEITNNFTAVADIENIEVGWMHFPTGAAPVFRLSKIGEPKPARPNADFTEGFRLVMKLSAATAEGKSAIRELTGNAKVIRKGMDELHNEYLEGIKDNPGKLPVVKLEKTIPVVIENKHGKQTNYQPVFKIIKWVPRPEDLQPVASVPASSAPASAPPSTGSKTVAPPAAAKVPELEDEFG